MCFSQIIPNLFHKVHHAFGETIFPIECSVLFQPIRLAGWYTAVYINHLLCLLVHMGLTVSTLLIYEVGFFFDVRSMKVIRFGPTFNILFYVKAIGLLYKM